MRQTRCSLPSLRALASATKSNLPSSQAAKLKPTHSMGFGFVLPPPGATRRWMETPDLAQGFQFSLGMADLSGEF